MQFSASAPIFMPRSSAAESNPATHEQLQHLSTILWVLECAKSPKSYTDQRLVCDTCCPGIMPLMTNVASAQEPVVLVEAKNAVILLLLRTTVTMANKEQQRDMLGKLAHLVPAALDRCAADERLSLAQYFFSLVEKEWPERRSEKHRGICVERLPGESDYSFTARCEHEAGVAHEPERFNPGAGFMRWLIASNILQELLPFLRKNPCFNIIELVRAIESPDFMAKLVLWLTPEEFPFLWNFCQKFAKVPLLKSLLEQEVAKQTLPFEPLQTLLSSNNFKYEICVGVGCKVYLCVFVGPRDEHFVNTALDGKFRLKDTILTTEMVVYNLRIWRRKWREQYSQRHHADLILLLKEKDLNYALDDHNGDLKVQISQNQYVRVTIPVFQGIRQVMGQDFTTLTEVMSFLLASQKP